MYEIKPSTIKTAEVPKRVLLLTLPVKEHETKITAPTKTNIKPRFFNKRNYFCKKTIIEGK